MDRILLVNPPDTAQTGFTNPPLGLLYLAGTLLAGGFQVKVVDACLDGIEAVDQALHEFNPMMVGITCLTPGRKKAVEVGDRCKRYNSSIKVVIGGVHPTIMYRQMLEHYKCIDYLVLGEGEQTFLELARGIEPGGIAGLAFMNSGRVVKTARRELIQDLDQIPFPAWHLIDLHRYPSIGDKVFRGIDLGRESRISVIFSRGCKGHCDFCSTWWIWRGWRHRSPKNMVDELELLSREHGIRHFCFADDALTVDREATICLCDEIVARGLNIAFHATTRTDCVDAELLVKLARAGCYNIAFGVETGSAVLLDRMNKENEVATAERAILLAKDAGITTTALIIVGNIGETTQTIEETVRFLKRAKPDIVGCAGALWILPGTRVFQECKKIGFIDDDFWLGDKPYKVYDLEWSISQLREMEEKIYDYQNVSVGEVMASEKYPCERPSNIPPKWYRYFKPEVNEYSATTEWIDAQPQHLALMKLLPHSAIDVLDLGCGDGWSTHTLLGMGKRATGVTINPKEAEHAMQRYGIDLVVRDMHDLPFTDHTFDAVYCRECYEHSIAPYIALCEMNRVLKLSGHALINLPWDGWIREDSHFSVLTPAQMREMFFKCRFVVEREGRTSLGHYWYLGRKVAEMTQSHPFSPPVPGKKWLEGMVVEPILSPEPKQQPKPPRIICQMRIKNEDRWIQDVLDSIAKVAQGIIILDDGSTDRTQEICKQHPAVLEYYWQSEPVIDEVRDKNRLIKMTLAHDPDWILCMDGDEIFEDSASERICEAIRNCPEDVSVLDIEFLYMWNDLNHYRVDGIYGRLFHHRLFKLEGQDRQALSFTPTGHGGNFHCESVPPNICGRSMEIDVKIKHLGYMYRADREHKYYWYKSNDTVHAVQGYYEHLLDQPGMALAEWNERPISYDREAASIEAVGQTLVPKQEVKPDYYYANARRNIADLVPQSARRVLDVGCGQGLTGGLLRVERGIEVVGVELHSEVAEIAKSHLSRVVVGDLESMDLPFDHGYFDCIIFADVLEHLVNPWGALQKVVKYLSIGGTIIASIPNIRNLDVLSKLAGGTWGYTEQGIMDRTHLRFFALADMFKLFEQVGIQARVAEVVRDPVFASMDLRALIKPTNLEFGRLVIRDATPAEVEEWTTIQFIFTGTRVQIGEEGTPGPREVQASVVIPVFNNFGYTKQCIESLFAVREKTPFEVIVVDDASTDGTADRIREIPFPVQVVKHQENRGFAASCNDGAKQAKGRFVVFLNNDTIVLPGWLDAMVASVDSDPTVGLVGNLQIFPDSGKVQQAGIVCGAGKMAYSIYNNDLPADHPAVNKPREFQLIGGSCMLLEREFFFQLNCFDEAYLNSCEDVDLCMKVREAGRKVWYCPKSRIYHFESKTVSGHSKAGQNYQRFLAKWGDKLVQDDQRILEDDGFHAPTLNRSATQEVLLIAPPRNFKQAQVSGYSGFSKNLGLAYIAAVLRDHGLHVSILDAFALGIDQFTPVDRPNGRVFRCGLSVEFILSRIQPTARWVGINVPFSNVAEIAFDLARQIKMHHPYVKVVLGGVHPSTFPEASLQQPGVDYVIAGEGEYAMLNLVMGVDPSTIDGLWWRDAQGNVHAPANPARVAVLDQLPLPAWDLLPMERYLARSPRGDQHHKTLSLVTSRGCPFGCSFCSIHPVAGRNWRARSPQNVLMEVREAIQRYGINHLEIEDDNFTLDRDRALAILEGLKAFPGLTWAAHNGLRVDTLDEELLTAIRDSGCIQLNLAIEHGSASVLRSMNKRLSLQKVEGVVKICGKLGIHCIGFCIVGHPGETNEAFRESFLFFKRLRQHGLSSVVSFIVNAYPGTRLYQEARREGWLNPATDSQLFFIEDEFVSVTTPDFKADTVHRRKEAMEKLNAYPSIDTDALLSSLDLGVTSFGLGNKQKSFMALSVLKNKADILTARAELAKRVLDLTSEDTCREFSGKGYITPIGDTAKSWDVLKTIEFFESDVAKTAPILDIGSFCSEIPGMLHRLGYSNISGIDLNPDVVRMPYCENIHYSIGNFIQTSFPDESFAAITAISVIEHGFNSTELISEVHRLLKPGGYFIASVDYWKEKISTDGLSAFNMDWKIFSGDEIMDFLDEAARHDLLPPGPLDLETGDRTISWNNREYTFAWLVLRKADQTAPKSMYFENHQSIVGKPMRIAFLSTFNQPCGIATHTGYVINGIQKCMETAGTSVKILILAEDTVDRFTDDPQNVIRCWRRSDETFEHVIAVLEEQHVDILHIQFQIGLYARTRIDNLVQTCVQRGIKVFITFHSSEAGFDICSRLINLTEKSFVHLEQGALRFIAGGAHPAKLLVVPHGILDSVPDISVQQAKKNAGLDPSSPIISSFGFILPHKGIKESLLAFPKILNNFPRSCFYLLGGVQPGNPTSLRYLEECQQLSVQMGFADRVFFSREYLPEDEISRILLISDCIIMNYTWNVNEVSGAAAFALAHRRPMVTSPSPGFRPLLNCTLQSSEELDVASAVSSVLESSNLRNHLDRQTRIFIEENSYARLGELLLAEYDLIGKRVRTQRRSLRDIFDTSPAISDLLHTHKKAKVELSVEKVPSQNSAQDKIGKLNLMASHISFDKWGPKVHDPECIKPIEKNEGRLTSRLQNDIVWIGPIFNPSGYASEGISFILGLDSFIHLKIRHNSIFSQAFVDGMPPKWKEILLRLHIIPPKEYAMPLNVGKNTVLVQHNPAGSFLKADGVHCRIGRTMFETDRIPADWVQKCNDMDEVWVPSQFNKGTFVQSGVKEDKIVIIPESLDTVCFNPDGILPLELPNKAGYNFLSIFEWTNRKGWDVLLRSYFETFTKFDDVCLYIRTYLLSHYDADTKKKITDTIDTLILRHGYKKSRLPRFELLTNQLPFNEMLRLYKSVDAFVLPSRGEGWGRPQMEAMAFGLPVIATNWSGSTEFMNNDNSYLIDVDRLVTIKENEIPFYLGHRWAEPSRFHLKQIMRHVYSQQDEAKKKGEAARTHIIQKYNLYTVARIIVDRLQQIDQGVSAHAVTFSGVTKTEELRAARPKIVWEGSQLVNHSLALINRELCLRIIEAGHELSIIPYELDQFSSKDEPRFKPIAARTKKSLSGPADVHVRHQWPPNFTPPPEGQWVIIQPWEFGSLPKEWVRQMSSHVDEVWVPSHYVRDCYIKSGVPAEKVFVVANGVNTDLFNPGIAPYQLKTKKGFKFLFVGGTIHRKGIDILLDAYMKTFSLKDDICLVIKDLGGNTFYKGQTAEKLIEEYRSTPDAPEIEYIESVLNEKEMAGLYNACNCLVHPYRGEGFGLPIAEAMACQLPVIVTGYGAALDFCTPDNSYLLPAKEIRFSDKKIGGAETVDYPWLAEPDRESLKTLMQHVIEQPEDAMVKARAARVRIETEFSWKKAGENVIRRLNEIVLKPVARFNQNVEIKRSEIESAVSIIIRVSNDLDLVRKCFRNIKKHTSAKYEVIFIVKGSNTKKFKWVKQTVKENGNCRYLENSEEFGWVKENNQGIKESSGDYILLLDPHAVIAENWLSDLLECIKHDPKIGIVGVISDEISNRQGANANYQPERQQPEEHDSSFRERNRYRRIPAQKVSSLCMLFKRQLIDEIGLIDEIFDDRNYGAEDLCQRASLAGYQNVVAGDVYIGCHNGKKPTEKCIERDSLKANRRFFYDKWYGVDFRQGFGQRLLIANATAKANELYRQGHIEKATASMLEALKQGPGNRCIYFKLAEMLIDAKRYNDALGIMESIPQGGADARQLALLGYCEEALEHSDKAQEYAEAALVIDPSNPLALNVMGVVAYKKGEQATGEGLFKKAIESDPGFGESYTNIGSLKWAAGEHIEALDLFERGFILSPTIGDVVTAYHSAVVETNSFARSETVFREARALYPNDKRIAFLMIAVLIKQEKHELAMDDIEQAMMQFGIDDGILSAALEVRAKIGPLTIPSGSTRRSLSICMIVKNEELNLSKCLMSVKPVADEIIVVDTGSADKTKAIASALGAKVFDFPWTSDFSEARNYSLSKASGDWILVLDADELVSPLDHNKLKKLINSKAEKCVAYTMITRNYTDQAGSRDWSANEGRYIHEEVGRGWIPSPKVRLFVNDKRINFVNPVHELVEPTLEKLGIKIKTCDVPVHHYGRLNQDKLIAKGKEYYRLGIAKIEKSKGEGEYNALRELAIQAAEIGEYAEAVNVWGKALELKPNDAAAFMNMGFAFLMMKQYDKAAEHSKKAMDLDPDFREAALNYSAAELIAGDVKKAISTLESILKNNTDYPPAMGRLAAACMIDGRKEEGLRYLDRLIIKGFDCSSMMEEQSQAFLSEGRIEQAVLLLQAALEKGLNNFSTHALLAECQQKMKGSTSVSEQIDPSCILPGPAAGVEATAQADRLKVSGKNSDISRRRTQTDADFSSADMAEEKRLALRAGEMGGTRQGARGGAIGSSSLSK